MENFKNDKPCVRLHKAIKANICEPKEKELESFTIERKLRASPSDEGDSQVGIILFVGIGTANGLSKKEIINYLDIKANEYAFKLKKYNEKMKKSSDKNRYQIKTNLVQNYLKLNYKYL